MSQWNAARDAGSLDEQRARQMARWFGSAPRRIVRPMLPTDVSWPRYEVLTAPDMRVARHEPEGANSQLGMWLTPPADVRGATLDGGHVWHKAPPSTMPSDERGSFFHRHLEAC